MSQYSFLIHLDSPRILCCTGISAGWAILTVYTADCDLTIHCISSFHPSRVSCFDSQPSRANDEGTCGLWVQQLLFWPTAAVSWGPGDFSSQSDQMISSQRRARNIVHFLGKEELSSGEDVIRHPLLIKLHMSPSYPFASISTLIGQKPKPKRPLFHWRNSIVIHETHRLYPCLHYRPNYKIPQQWGGHAGEAGKAPVFWHLNKYCQSDRQILAYGGAAWITGVLTGLPVESLQGWKPCLLVLSFLFCLHLYLDQ